METGAAAATLHVRAVRIRHHSGDTHANREESKRACKVAEVHLNAAHQRPELIAHRRQTLDGSGHLDQDGLWRNPQADQLIAHRLGDLRCFDADAKAISVFGDVG